MKPINDLSPEELRVECADRAADRDAAIESSARGAVAALGCSHEWHYREMVRHMRALADKLTNPQPKGGDEVCATHTHSDLERSSQRRTQLAAAQRERDSLRDQLRTEVARLTKERDEAREHSANVVNDLMTRDKQLMHSRGVVEIRCRERDTLAATVSELQRDREVMLIALDSAAQIFEEMDGVTWNEDSDWQSSSYAGAADEVVKTLAAMQAKGAQ